MAGLIGNGVSLEGLFDVDSAFTWNVSGVGITDKITAAAAVGKAVAQDTTLPTTAKLAGDGDAIIGVFGSVEYRAQEGTVLGAVLHEGAFRVPYTGVIAIGNMVCGSATAGSVKALAGAPADFRQPNRVTEFDPVSATCVVLFI